MGLLDAPEFPGAAEISVERAENGGVSSVRQVSLAHSHRYPNALMMVIFTAVGYLMRKLQLSFVNFIIGFLLGPMLELSIQQTLTMSLNNPIIILKRPIALGFFVLTAIFLWRVNRGNKERERP